MKINRISLFTSEVFVFQLPEFKDWKKLIKQIVLVENNKDIHGHDTLPLEKCNVMAKRTAWNSHQRYPVLNVLCEEIKKYLLSFIQKENYDVPDLFVQNCWINWYDKNNFSQPHDHGAALSVILFVDVEKTDAKLFFHSDNNLVLVKRENTYNNFSNVRQVDAEDGSVIFFDGSLSHSVSANQTSKTRITVAINYDVDYKTNR